MGRDGGRTRISLPWQLSIWYLTWGMFVSETEVFEMGIMEQKMETYSFSRRGWSVSPGEEDEAYLFYKECGRGRGFRQQVFRSSVAPQSNTSKYTFPTRNASTNASTTLPLTLVSSSSDHLLLYLTFLVSTSSKTPSNAVLCGCPGTVACPPAAPPSPSRQTTMHPSLSGSPCQRAGPSPAQAPSSQSSSES